MCISVACVSGGVLRRTKYRPKPPALIGGVAMDTEPYPVVAGLLIRKAVTW